MFVVYALRVGCGALGCGMWLMMRLVGFVLDFCWFVVGVVAR